MNRLLSILMFPVLIALLAGPAAAQDFPFYNDGELRDFAVLTPVEYGANFCVLEFSLEVPDPSRIPNRASYPFWITAPRGSSVTITLEDVELLAVTEDEEVLGPLLQSDGAETPCGSVPRTLMSPRSRYVDDFRSVGMFQSEFGIVGTSVPVKDDQGKCRLMVSKATVRVTFEGGEEAPASLIDLKENDPYLLDIGGKIIANHGQLDQSWRPDGTRGDFEELRAWSEMLTEAHENESLAFAWLPRGGLYKFTPDDFQRAGVDFRKLDAEKLYFFLGKDELPVLTRNVSRGRISDNSSFLVFVPFDEEDKKPYLPLWVFQANRESPPRRIKVTPSTDRSEAFDAVGWIRRVVFEPRHFHHLFPPHGPQLKWATGTIDEGTFADFEFDARGVYRSSQPSIKTWLTTSLGGRTLKARIYINGNLIATREFRGVTIDAFETEFSPTYLREGTNRLTIENVRDPNAEAPHQMAFLQAELKIAVNTSGLPVQEPIAVRVDRPGAMAMEFAAVNGDGGPYLMVDCTRPLDPVFHEMKREHGRSGGLRHSAMLRESGEAAPRVMYAGEKTLLRPVEFYRVAAPRSFKETKQVDYLVVVDQGLMETATELIEYREQTSSVDYFSVFDAYSAFSYGEVSYQAVRDAIRHTFRHREGARLREVLLIGEGAEFWWHNRRPSAHVSPNMLPVFGWQDPKVTIRGDDSYSLLSGSGPLSDIEIGRISVATTADLKAVIDKIKSYEATTPAGEWINRHIFVTDDEPEFARVTYDILAKSMTGPNIPVLMFLQDFPYEDYFRIMLRKRSVVMTDKLLEELSVGARTVTYMGHGGPNLWSSERILHLRDIDLVDNEGRVPMVISGSCDTGWIDYPIEPVRESIAEAMLRHPTGGAIGLWIPIAGTSSYEHNFLLTAFFDGLFQYDYRDIGTMTLLSKIQYYLDRNNTSVTNQFLLMGDPGLQLIEMPGELTVETAPKEFLEIGGGTLEFAGEIPGMTWGQAKVSLLDEQYKPVQEQRVKVFLNRFSGSMEMPRIMSPGDYHLIVTAFNAQEGKVVTKDVTIPVNLATARMTWTTEPANDEVIEAGVPIAINFELENLSKMPFERARLVINYADRPGEPMANTVLSIAAGDSYKRTFNAPLPQGIHYFDAKLYPGDAPLEEYRPPIVEEELVLKVKGPDTQLVAFSVGSVKARNRPGGRGARVELTLHNLSGHDLFDMGALLLELDAADDDIGDPLGAVALIPFLRRDESIDVAFESATILPPHPSHFALEIRNMAPDPPELVQLTRFLSAIVKGPDLEIVEDSVRLENENPISGNTVFIHATVKNSGDVAARSVEAGLFLGKAWDPAARAPVAPPGLSFQPITELLPGESRPVRLRWDPRYGTLGTATVTVAVRGTADMDEIEFGNNSRTLDVEFLSPPNLRIIKEGIRRSSEVIAPSELVHLSIPIENDSEHDFVRDFKVTVTAKAFGGEPRIIHTDRIQGLLAGEGATLQVDWLVETGENVVTVVLNEDKDYAETDFSDNQHSFKVDYLLTPKYFKQPSLYWDFHALPELGEFVGIKRSPEGFYHVEERHIYWGKEFPLLREHLVEGSVGELWALDNRFGLDEIGNLVQMYQEDATPVKFRMPMPEVDNTTFYDVFIGHIGTADKEVLSGHFRYRLEGDRDWTVEKRDGSGFVFLRTVETVDNALDFELGTVDYPVKNHFWSMLVTPAKGRYLSPIMDAERMPSGRLLADFETAGGSRLDFEVRYGSGDRNSITWTPWEPAATGELLPAAPKGAHFFQWQVSMYRASDGDPKLWAVAIELEAPKAERATIMQQREVAR